MHHNGRLFEIAPLATNWLQWFFSLYKSEKKSNSADRTGIVLLRHSFECIALWVTAKVLRLHSRNSCELHSFINKSQPTVGSFECDGHPCRHLLVARERLLCFFCLMLFSVDRWVRRKVAEFHAALGWRILLFQNCWSVSPEFRVLLHTHTAQEPVLCFITLLLYSHTVFLHLWLLSDLVQWI